MRVIFAGGGTGGHINPAISIADYIKSHDKNFEALFIGTERGLEKKLVPAKGYEIRYIDIRGFDRRNLVKNFVVLKKLSIARRECRNIIREFKPDCIVCTGGYVSGPVAMAAKKEGIPALIHEQNVYPGLTVKGAEKYVEYVAVSFEETIEHMKNRHKCVVTGNPVRKEILSANAHRSRELLKLSDKPFVLIFGGSLGADRINETVVGMLERIAEERKIQLLFGTGDRNFDKISEQIKDIKLPADIQIVPYINNMHLVMSAADLVIARSGAITVSEIAALGKPSMLIPSPNVVRNHQEQNAREFEKHGAAAVITEDELTPETLYNKMMSMIMNPAELSRMSAALKSLAQTDALEKMYALIKDMSKK